MINSKNKDHTNDRDNQHDIKNEVLPQDQPLPALEEQSRKKRIFDMLIKQTKNNNAGKGAFPTVRKIIQTMSLSNLIQPQHKHSQQNQSIQSYFASVQANQMSPGNFSSRQDSYKKMKSISRLISLKTNQNDKIKQQQDQAEKQQIKKAILDIIDDLHDSKNANVFYSQPHFLSHSNSPQRSFKTFRQNQSEQKEDHKQISNISSLTKLAIHNKSIQNTNKSISVIKAQETYLNTLKELDIRKKFQIHRQKLYNTIDPDKTQKWFFSPQNSKKKLVKLFEQKTSNQGASKCKSSRQKPSKCKSSKQQISKYKQQKNKQTPSNQRPYFSPQKAKQIQGNEYVSKLIQKSLIKHESKKSQMQAMLRPRDKSKSLIASNKDIFNSIEYKGKGKQYFTLDCEKIKKQDKIKAFTLRSRSSVQRQDDYSQLLPQIKVYAKYKI